MLENVVDLSPYWRVRPAGTRWQADLREEGVPLVGIRPGAGFGDGTHETTQLCLLALGYLERIGFVPATVLDFGAGSGILSIAAARLGARVEAVEIDGPSRAHALENARANAVETLVDIRERPSEPPRLHDLVIANILGPVLLEHAGALCDRQSRAGRMVLSGLVATDVPAILARFGPMLVPMRSQIHARGEWRAILFVPAAAGSPASEAS